MICVSSLLNRRDFIEHNMTVVDVHSQYVRIQGPARFDVSVTAEHYVYIVLWFADIRSDM